MLGLVLHALELHPAHSQLAWVGGTPGHRNPGCSPLPSTIRRVTRYPHTCRHGLLSPSTTPYSSQGPDIPGRDIPRLRSCPGKIRVRALPGVLEGPVYDNAPCYYDSNFKRDLSMTLPHVIRTQSSIGRRCGTVLERLDPPRDKNLLRPPGP
jgi:hypothetical protein